jgi:DNA-binding transcriptional LysR family regulator
MDMDTEALRWFQLVADGVTVTEVSELFMVSQPGVSRALTRIEKEVGTPLLQRSGRVLRLTHAGAIFKRHVDGLIHELDDGLAAVSQLVDPETGTVRVAFQLSLGSWLIPQVVRTFHTDHPQVEFRLEQSVDALGSSLLSGGRVDVEFTSRRPRNPLVLWERLFSEPLYLAVPPGHLAAAAPPKRTIDLADVAGEDFVMLRPEWELRALTDELCATAGFTPRSVYEGDDLQTMIALVAAGLGVALVPAMGNDPSRRAPTRAALVPLTDAGAARDIGMAWSAERRLLPAAESFRRHVLGRDWPVAT